MRLWFRIIKLKPRWNRYQKDLLSKKSWDWTMVKSESDIAHTAHLPLSLSVIIWQKLSCSCPSHYSPQTWSQHFSLFPKIENSLKGYIILNYKRLGKIWTDSSPPSSKPTLGNISKIEETLGEMYCQQRGYFKGDRPE